MLNPGAAIGNFLRETLLKLIWALSILPPDQRTGRFRISASACNRVESALFVVMAALFSSDGAKLLSFASALRFMFELSAFWIAVRKAAI